MVTAAIVNPGSRVRFEGRNGTVLEENQFTGVQVKWDDGVIDWLPWGVELVNVPVVIDMTRPGMRERVRAIHVKAGLNLHVRSNGAIQITRGAGPKFLMKAASELTGKTFRSRDYSGAIAALETYLGEAT